MDVEAGPSGLPMEGKRENSKSFPKPLTTREKEYFLAVERGNMAAVRRILDESSNTRPININCVDSLGRSTVLIAIENENLQMVRLLVTKGVEMKDALLQAIDKEYVECVEFLLDYEEMIHEKGQPYSWEKVDKDTATFTTEVTPLILAGHRDNYEVLKLLLDRGATLPVPHDVRCSCDTCILSSHEDSLRYSRWRFSAYRALASPSLIALSSTDPILTAFELCWELKNLSAAENEYKEDYLGLRAKCEDFAMDLLAQARSSTELEVLLNYDPSHKPDQLGQRMKLTRLKVAIEHNQKMFVAHPNVQQLLSSLWYQGLPGFRRKNLLKQILAVIKIAVLFPFYSFVYIIAPSCAIATLMRKPFMKFLIHSASYLFFLLLLILASQRVETLIAEILASKGWTFDVEDVLVETPIEKGNPPSIVEWAVLFYVIGFIWQEAKQLSNFGLWGYISDMWNGIEFIRNLFYVVTIGLRFLAFIQAKIEIYKNPLAAFIPREHWGAFDPMLIAEGLFAVANIFSALKLLHMFSINQYLGPLQISLGRMVIDIIKFFFIYTLVLFSFACGLNQLLWYYSNLEKQKCYSLNGGLPDWKSNSDSCMIWRRFYNLFESSQSLFWASFGMIDLRNFELTGIQSYTRFWALLMFGSYSIINVVVLLNLLIAMMSNSYNAISDRSDTEWKFARTKLWLSYFDEGSTVPPPFNLIPAPKTILRCFGCCKKGKDIEAVVQAIVWRYITQQQRKRELAAVTEDTIDEVKQDISAFRYEILDVLAKNGYEISGKTGKIPRRVSDKKTKVWERRLLSDFTVAPVESCAVEEPPQGAEQARTNFQRLVRSVGPGQAKKTSRLWRSLASAARRLQQGTLIIEEEALTRESSKGKELSVRGTGDLDSTQHLPASDLETLNNLVNFESNEPESSILMSVPSIEPMVPNPMPQTNDSVTHFGMEGCQVEATTTESKQHMTIYPEVEVAMQEPMPSKPVLQNFDPEPTLWMEGSQEHKLLMNNYPEPQVGMQEPHHERRDLQQVLPSQDLDGSNDDDDCSNNEKLDPYQEVSPKRYSDLPIVQKDSLTDVSTTMTDDDANAALSTVDDSYPLLQQHVHSSYEEEFGVRNIGYGYFAPGTAASMDTVQKMDSPSSATTTSLQVPSVSSAIENVKIVKRKWQGAWL